MEQVIDITSKRDGFRRAGMVHSEKTQTYPLSQFTKAQIALLQSEPMLVVAIRNKDETSDADRDQVEALKKKVLELEEHVQILVTQEGDARQQVSDLMAELNEASSSKALAESLSSKFEELNEELATERQKVSNLTTELEGERQKVTDLTAKLKAATRKGK